MPNSTILSIAHFNDVYQVTDQKININGQQETINVSKFATLLAGVTSKWKDRSDGRKDGVIVFSGDLFSPSKESSITRGKHIVNNDMFIHNVVWKLTSPLVACNCELLRS